MEAFDEDFNLTKTYYKGLEAIVTSKPVHSKRWYFDYLYDSEMEGQCVDAFLLYHQVMVPFVNGLAYIFDNHVAPCMEEEQATELRQFFQPINPIEFKEGESPVSEVIAIDSELHEQLDAFDGLDDETPDDEFDKTADELGRLLLERLEYRFGGHLHLYWKLYKALEPKEIRLMDSLLQRPVAQRIVRQAWEEFVEEEGVEAAENRFDLPDDFFKQDLDDSSHRDHLYIHPKVKARGSHVFVQFINYLADCGYINDDAEVKSLLAYRLTGRCRPEGELPAIQWNGKNGKSYELVYVVRYLTERGDYKKMRQFFAGPEWVKDRDSSYANSANSEFRRFLCDLYPEVCPFVK